MALLQDLILQIDDPVLRERILKETNKLVKQKKFGLVFEEHLPECTPLYNMPIRVGAKIALKTGYVKDIYTVLKIDGNNVLCDRRDTHEQKIFNIDEIVVVAEFGEAIYPTLQLLDYVENDSDSDLWHTLIEADNYHALQLLEYLYAGKVDCIYIDPPYNTGAKDWKYNNDYVDGSDAYRHSKWLSMMEKRLKLAKNLLNPITGVLIVTIDEHEVHHLRTLLEQIFSDFYIQMVTCVTNPTGATQGRFSRIEEYAIYCFASGAYVNSCEDPMIGENVVTKHVRWKSLLRSGTSARREDRKNMFYPVYVDSKLQVVVNAGFPLPYNQEPNFNSVNGYEVVWPVRSDGTLGRWSVSYETLNRLISKGYVQLGKYDKKRRTYSITYISNETQKMIENGEIKIVGVNEKTGVVKIEYSNEHTQAVRTVWYRTRHNAGTYGTNMLSSIIKGDKNFTFPKSLYVTHDSLITVMKQKKDALILDFFAGSGTTLHAVNLMNYEDNGKRKCILVTNNECSNEDVMKLKNMGLQPGDNEWEKNGICKAVTWPRIKYTITGKRDDNTEIAGDYITNLTKKEYRPRKFVQLNFIKNAHNLKTKDKKMLLTLLSKGNLPQSLVKINTKYIVSKNNKHTVSILFDDTIVDEWIDALEGMDHVTDFYILTDNSDIFNLAKNNITELLGEIEVLEKVKKPMKDGFKTNAVFFKLNFLDKMSVALGKQFKELLPVLWMKSGSIGKCPVLDCNELPHVLILPKNKMAILLDEVYYSEFEQQMELYPEIQTIFIITDSEMAYREMIHGYEDKNCYQLYRDYLDNFRINIGR